MSPVRNVPIGDDGRELSQREASAIAEIQKLARRWPESLYLASMGGTLHVMRKNEDGEHAMEGDQLDQDYIVDTVRIENTGGDW